MNTTRKFEREYQVRKALRVIEHYAEIAEARWLYDFMRGVIPADKNVVLLTADTTDWDVSFFSYLHPRIVSIYYSVNLSLGLGIGLDYFIRGAATAASVVSEHQLEMVGEMLKLQHEAMYESETFPYVAEKYLEDYVTIITTALVSPETTTWRQMLAFVSVVYWLLSFVDMKADEQNVSQTIYDILVDRAKKGFIDFI